MRRRRPILRRRPSRARVHQGTRRDSTFSEHHTGPYGPLGNGCTVDASDKRKNEWPQVAFSSIKVKENLQENLPIYQAIY